MNTETIKDIENRPAELFNIPNYKNLPERNVFIDMEGVVGDFLTYDIFNLDGVQPLELRHMNANNGVTHVDPSEISMDIYKKERVKFQLIFVVVNCYGFREIDGKLIGKPYNISLMPSSKRGVVSTVTPEWVEKINLEGLGQIPSMYKGFNPFLGAYGMYFHGTLSYSNIPSDMLGFVHNTYALAMPFDHREVLAPGIPQLEGSAQAQRDYEKYRKDRYYKPFNKVKPRRVWGCDSPIELFLLQALDSIGLNPELQTIICTDGFTAPTFHKLWENHKSRRKLKAITEADFFFPDKKLAVFCDSVAHHSSAEAIAKDKKIDEKLNEIGIESLRICGRDIAKSPFECAKLIEKIISKSA